MHAQTLQTQLGLTTYVMQRNLEGITHDDSLRQPQPSGNCANWALGHIVRTRNKFLAMFTGQPMFDLAKYDQYEVDPVTDPSKAVNWDEMVKDYEALSEPLLEAIGKLPDSKMNEKSGFSPTGNPDETVGSLLAAFAFHEAYHSGQIGLLRRLSGKAGAIKSPEAAAR